MIYHVTNRALWEKALLKGMYAHPSLETEGFIHTSTEQQLMETLALHFTDVKEVWVLHIVEKRLKNKIKWEPAREQLFAHIYGQIPLEAIEDVSFLLKNEQGFWEWNKKGL
jgi:uncharacterized protein (DUF952 family)